MIVRAMKRNSGVEACGHRITYDIIGERSQTPSHVTVLYQDIGMSQKLINISRPYSMRRVCKRTKNIRHQ